VAVTPFTLIEKMLENKMILLRYTLYIDYIMYLTFNFGQNPFASVLADRQMLMGYGNVLREGGGKGYAKLEYYWVS